MAKMKLQARVEFASDGMRFHTIKKAKTTIALWKFFTRNVDIRQQIHVNPYAKFRLIGETGLLIGELPKKITLDTSGSNWHNIAVLAILAYIALC